MTAIALLLLTLLQATALASRSTDVDEHESDDLSAMLQIGARTRANAATEAPGGAGFSFLQVERAVSRARSHDAYTRHGLLPAVSQGRSVLGSLSFLQVMSHNGMELSQQKLNLVLKPQLWEPTQQDAVAYEARSAPGAPEWWTNEYLTKNNTSTQAKEEPHLSKRDMGFESGEPLVSCHTLPNISATDAQKVQFQADANLKKAGDLFCKAGLGRLTEFYVDPKFRANHATLAAQDGWIDEAFVTYVKITKEKAYYADEIDLLVQSVHHFSSRPIIVANVGDYVPEEWTGERFPHMILVHAKKLSTDQKFNFNKFRAMLFTKVRTGIVVDSDQFVSGGVDEMFHRTFEEVTAEYPYPIMPVHWMSRDPESNDDYNMYSWRWEERLGSGGLKAVAQAPKRTMRWAHAHPTFTHHALPFLAKWTAYELAPDKTNPPAWLQRDIEDEDTMNVALWAENATKQWCKFDQINPVDYQTFVTQDAHSDLSNRFADKKWFPNGIPMVFYTAHDVKNATTGAHWLERVWNRGAQPRKTILYNGTWFNTPAQLYKYDPHLNCMV